MKSQVKVRSTACPGFLLLGSLWGFGIGYLIADGAAQSIGEYWYTNPRQQYLDFSLGCFILGPIIGLVCGIFADLTVPAGRLRDRIIEFNIVLMIIAILWFACLPDVQRIRE